jgi:hypothetical protein
VVAWYCKIDDVEHGPLSQDDLVKMASEGRLAADDLVRNEQKKKWYKAGSVKGLKFPTDGKPGMDSKLRETEPLAAPSSGTSAEAVRLLKGLTKKGGSSSGGQMGGGVATQPRTADDWKPAPSRVMQKAERKPLDPRTKRILWAAAAVIVALVLFPPHQVPEGYALQPGWHWSPVFMPPKARIKLFEEGDKDVKGVGAFDEMDIAAVEENGKKVFYAKAPMPIAWRKLFLECFTVIVVAAAAIGFLAIRTAAEQAPEIKPAHPPRRKHV